MRPFVVSPVSHVEGELSLLGDKSIAHRSIIISAISRGLTRIENFPANKDCLSTIKAFKKLGVKITKSSSTVSVNGAGILGLRKPKGPILVGDSGTALRLLLGVLAGQNFETELIAGSSLSQRPMRRVTEPLRMMGALIKSKISAKGGSAYGGKIKKSKIIEEYPPITIKGGNLKPIKYKMLVASAQVKSAILLAGLYTRGATEVIEPIKTRDHTERMLRLFKADIKVNKNTIVIKGNRELISPGILAIPGDISSAAFFIVLATIIPDSRVLVKNVSLNPSRTGVIRVLKRMGADINIKYQKSSPFAKASGDSPAKLEERRRTKIQNSEPIGNILVKSSDLKGTIIRKKEIPSLIDELPILMVAASNARGVTVFEGVSELRVKETDRIKSMAENLKVMGASIQVKRAQETENIIIEGVKQLKGAKVRSFGDHRTAMSMIVAGLKARGKTLIDDITCISKSFPKFLDSLRPLIN